MHNIDSVTVLFKPCFQLKLINRKTLTRRATTATELVTLPNTVLPKQWDEATVRVVEDRVVDVVAPTTTPVTGVEGRDTWLGTVPVTRASVMGVAVMGIFRENVLVKRLEALVETMTQ